MVPNLFCQFPFPPTRRTQRERPCCAERITPIGICHASLSVRTTHGCRWGQSCHGGCGLRRYQRSDRWASVFRGTGALTLKRLHRMSALPSPADYRSGRDRTSAGGQRRSGKYCDLSHCLRTFSFASLPWFFLGSDHRCSVIAELPSGRCRMSFFEAAFMLSAGTTLLCVTKWRTTCRCL